MTLPSKVHVTYSRVSTYVDCRLISTTYSVLVQMFCFNIGTRTQAVVFPPSEALLFRVPKILSDLDFGPDHFDLCLPNCRIPFGFRISWLSICHFSTPSHPSLIAGTFRLGRYIHIIMYYTYYTMYVLLLLILYMYTCNCTCVYDVL